MINYIHKDCSNVAFICDHLLHIGEHMSPKYFSYPDGTSPKTGDEIICFSCKKSITGNMLKLETQEIK